jgi:hypothetical protein
MKGKKDEIRFARPVEELERYSQAQVAAGEVIGKMQTLETKKELLLSELQSVQERLLEVRDRKTKAIEDLALGRISQAEYEGVKADIAKTKESLEEIGEQVTVIERALRDLSGAHRNALLKATGARYDVINAVINRETKEIRDLVGEKVTRIAMLVAQMGGFIEWGTQLTRVFPDPDLNAKQAIGTAVLAEIFGEEG